MVYFNGIDIISGRINLDFDFDKKEKEKVIKFTREKLGENVTINELSAFIEELQEKL